MMSTCLFLDWHEASNGDARQDDDSPATNGDGDRHTGTNDKQVKRAMESMSKVSNKRVV